MTKLIIDKRAILALNEVIKVIITLCVLFLLVLVPINIVQNYQKDKRVEQATSVLTEISAKVDYIKENEIKFDENILLLSPEKWFLFEGIERGQLCICFKSNYASCFEEGVCKIIDAEVEVYGEDKDKFIIIISEEVQTLFITYNVEEDRASFSSEKTDIEYQEYAPESGEISVSP